MLWNLNKLNLNFPDVLTFILYSNAYDNVYSDCKFYLNFEIPLFTAY